MTRLEGSTRLVRETGGVYHGQRLVVELGALTLRVRPKRARYDSKLDYLSTFQLGARKEAERPRAERQYEQKKRRV
jgi:hypothetical protein